MEGVDTNLLLQVGVGGIFAILLVRIILEWLKPLVEKFTGNGKHQERSIGEQLLLELQRATEEMKPVARQVSDLYDWHNQKNADGVFVWYVPSALTKAIDRLAENINTQTEVLRGLVTMVADQCKSTERLERKLEERNG